jgi:hypothetical protein
VWNFLLSFFAPRIADDIGPLILLIFAGMLVFGFFFVYAVVPETRGLALEEVDMLYRERVPAWKSPGWRPHGFGAGPGVEHDGVHARHATGDEKNRVEMSEDAGATAP